MARTQPSDWVSVMMSSTLHFGTIMSRLRESASGPTPPVSPAATLAALTSTGTALNLLMGNWPGSVRAWTANGASSFRRFNMSWRGVESLGLNPSMTRNWVSDTAALPVLVDPAVPAEAPTAIARSPNASIPANRTAA